MQQVSKPMIFQCNGVLGERMSNSSVPFRSFAVKGLAKTNYSTPARK